MVRRIILLACLVCLGFATFAQEPEESEPSKASFYMNADVVSRYLWRGLLYSPNVNIQPTAGLSVGNFFVGAWGSYAISDKYAEVDFFAGFTAGRLMFMVSDYYAEIETDMAAIDHFQWGADETAHALEATVSYTFGEGFPLTLTAATFFYGNDRDAQGDNYYSTYLEGSYPFSFSGYDFNLFAGGTPAEGLYAAEAALVNLGVSASKAIQINESISIPVSMSLVSNPKAEDIFFIVKVTL
jgi:hypothetical protein